MSTVRKIGKSDVVLLVPRRHWCLLRDQFDMFVYQAEENNDDEWRELMESIIRIPDNTWKALMADEYVLKLLSQPEVSKRAIIEKAEQADPRATYLLAVLKGERALSGADLKGTAASYWEDYRRSRRKAAEICREAGGHVRKSPKGKLTLEWTIAPRRAKKVESSVGAAMAY